MKATMNEDRRVVCIPVDGSEHAKRAFDWYLKELYKDKDYVLLVHCIEAPSLPALSVTAGFKIPVEAWSKALQENITKSEKLKTEYGYECESKGIPYEFLTMNGIRPGEGILNAIDQCKARLVVIGSRGLGFIKRTILGSVSTYVLHHTNVCCVIVPSLDK